MIDLSEPQPSFAKERTAQPANPKIYAALIAVKREVGAIDKNGTVKEYGSYDYRKFDDVLNAVAPLLNKYGVLVSGEVIEKQERQDGKKHFVTLTKQYRLFAEDGSSVTHSTVGEAFDVGDKAATKAQTVAYRIMLCEVLNIPYEDMADPEAGPQGEWSDNSKTIARFSKDIEYARSKPELSAVIGKCIDALQGVVPDVVLEKHEFKALWPKIVKKGESVGADTERLKLHLSNAVGETTDTPAIQEEKYGAAELDLLWKNATTQGGRDSVIEKFCGSVIDGTLSQQEIDDLIERRVVNGAMDCISSYYLGAILGAGDVATLGATQTELGSAQIAPSVRSELQRLAQHRISSMQKKGVSGGSSGGK